MGVKFLGIASPYPPPPNPLPPGEGEFLSQRFARYLWGTIIGFRLPKGVQAGRQIRRHLKTIVYLIGAKRVK